MSVISEQTAIGLDLPTKVRDLVVLGAGMAGMTLAARAAELGASVEVVERGPEIGGSAVLSGGYVWTAPDLDVLGERDPGANPALTTFLVQDYDDGLEWIRGLGVHVSDQVPGVLGFGRGHHVDIPAYMGRCRELVEMSGGAVVTNVGATDLVRGTDGIAGVVTTSSAGERMYVRAPWAALCTGGFQANAALRRRHVNPNAAPMHLRANPWSDGAGIGLGVEAGAALTAETMRGFYGHLFPSPLPALEPEDFIRLSQYHSAHAVLVNRAGKRFTDESGGDHLNAQAVLDQPGGVAYLIVDEEIRLEHVLGAFVPGLESGVDKLAEAARRGARYASVDSIEELAGALQAWGVDGQAAKATIADYNAAADRRSELSPPRRENRASLRRPPYVAVEVIAGITFTFGGLQIDGSARVLDVYGRPIRGLLSVGADAGIYDRGYAGGLVLGLVFGRRAAATACGRGIVAA